MKRIPDPGVFKPPLTRNEAKSDTTTRVSRAIIDEETAARAANTARLRAARLAREKSQSSENSSDIQPLGGTANSSIEAGVPPQFCPNDFTIADDPVGLGWKVTAKWNDGRTETITGFGTETDAEAWIKEDSARWLLDIPRQVQGRQWINDRLPKE